MMTGGIGTLGSAQKVKPSVIPLVIFTLYIGIASMTISGMIAVTITVVTAVGHPTSIDVSQCDIEIVVLVGRALFGITKIQLPGHTAVPPA